MNNTHKKGFTLVESLIAISILMLSVVGPLTLAQKSLASSIFSRDRVTAYYLAEDAMEYIRSIRDSRSALTGWASFISAVSPCSTTSGCIADSANRIGTSASVEDCGSACPPLKYNTRNGFYGYHYGASESGQPTDWVDTMYTRSVQITDVPSNAGHEVQVTVTVTWRSALFPQPRTFSISEDLLDWQ